MFHYYQRLGFNPHRDDVVLNINSKTNIKMHVLVSLTIFHINSHFDKNSNHSVPLWCSGYANRFQNGGQHRGSNTYNFFMLFSSGIVS